MWLALPTGFYSAVKHRDDPALLNVRGRSRVDLERLADWHEATYPDQPRPELLAFTPSDYPWRLFVSREAFAFFVGSAALGIDYGNFKNAVDKRSSPKRHSTYSRVWSALLDIEDEPGALDGHPRPSAHGRRPSLSYSDFRTSPTFREALGDLPDRGDDDEERDDELGLTLTCPTCSNELEACDARWEAEDLQDSGKADGWTHACEVCGENLTATARAARGEDDQADVDPTSPFHAPLPL